MICGWLAKIARRSAFPCRLAQKMAQGRIYSLLSQTKYPIAPQGQYLSNAEAAGWPAAKTGPVKIIPGGADLIF
jgi:hypothetical protein